MVPEGDECCEELCFACEIIQCKAFKDHGGRCICAAYPTCTTQPCDLVNQEPQPSSGDDMIGQVFTGFEFQLPPLPPGLWWAPGDVQGRYVVERYDTPGASSSTGLSGGVALTQPGTATTSMQTPSQSEPALTQYIPWNQPPVEVRCHGVCTFTTCWNRCAAIIGHQDIHACRCDMPHETFPDATHNVTQHSVGVNTNVSCVWQSECIGTCYHCGDPCKAINSHTPVMDFCECEDYPDCSPPEVEDWRLAFQRGHNKAI